MEELLRKIAIALAEKVLSHLEEDQRREIVDILKFSENSDELQEALDRILDELGKREAESPEFLDRLHGVLECLAEMVGVDPLELKTPKSVMEALEEIAELVEMGRERLSCVEKDRIERVKDYVVDLVRQIGKRYRGPDTDIIVRAVLERIERDDRSVFSPEIYKRIQDLIIERERELEFERAKVREKLKVVIKSIVDSLSTLGDVETSIVDSLNEHVLGIEDIIGLENINEITERLAQLSKDLRRTINRVKREMGRTRRELERTRKELEMMREELEKYKAQSVIDELTGVLNRRGIMEVIDRELARSKRFKSPLSVIMVDIDDFKRVNDAFGHIVGDKVLQTVAAIMKENLRATDVVGRYGGEEFLIVLPETEAEGAVVVAEKIRKAMEKKTFKYKDKTFKVTISAGVAEALEEDSVQSLIDRADKALYLSKSSGKNRVTTGR